LSGGERTCMNCRWSRWNGPHLGCYHGYRWRDWLRQRDARVFAVCETVKPELSRYYGCRWEPRGEG
jgi:hypothetical protein